MWKTGIRNLLVALSVIGFFVLVSFVDVKHKELKVKSFSIEFPNLFESDNFLEEDAAESIIISRVDTLIGRPIEKINLFDIEQIIEQEPGVKNAEAFMSVSGDVHLKIELKKVIVRLKPDSLPGFYIDTEGEIMKWVPNYTPRVFTISGRLFSFDSSVSDSLSGELINHKELINQSFELANFIKDSKFLSAQFRSAFVNRKGEFELIPLLGNQKIELGKAVNLKSKFDKLEVFYNKIAKKKGWDAYSKISVKYKGQIVCTKR